MSHTITQTEMSSTFACDSMKTQLSEVLLQRQMSCDPDPLHSVPKMRRIICINGSKHNLDPVLRARCIAVYEANLEKRRQKAHHLRAAL